MQPESGSIIPSALEKEEEIEIVLNQIRSRLEKAGFNSMDSLASTDPKELAEAVGISLQTATSIRYEARANLSKTHSCQQDIPRIPSFTRAAELRRQELSITIKGISTGSTSLDSLFGGNGIEIGAITQLYGESGSGKTQLCHTLCAMLSLDYKTVYIDTENTFLPNRVDSIAKVRGLANDKLLENIIVTNPANTDEQERFIDMICMDINQYSHEVKLLIVDSMTALYRIDYSQRSELHERQRRISKYMHMLQKIARRYKVAVIVTNQVHSYQEKYTTNRKFEPIGGNAMAYPSKHRVRLECLYSIDKFQAKLDFSYRFPRNVIDFIIDASGVTDATEQYEGMPDARPTEDYETRNMRYKVAHIMPDY